MLKIKKEAAIWALFAIIAAAFLLIEATHFNYAISDENTYYLMGKEIAEGKTPYKDFFFAHPPLEIYLFAAIIKFVGFNFLILKSTSAIFTIISALFIFKLAKEKWGAKPAIMSALLLFFSYDALRYANFPTGVCLTAMLMSIGFYYYSKGKNLTSGIFMGLAGTAGIYSLVATAAMGVMLLKKRKELLRFAAGAAITFATANLIFLIIAGNNYITQTITYHLKKQAQEASKISVFIRQLKINWLLFASSLLILLSKKARHEIKWAAAVIAAYVMFFLLLSNAFGYYSMLIFPLLALAGGYGLNIAIERYGKAAAVTTAILLIISIGTAASNFMSNDFQDFKNAEEIAAFVKENSNGNDEIFGDDSTTPLIAILAERKIALNMTDSNTMRFESGITNTNETIQELKKSKLKYFIARKLKLGEGSLTYGTASMKEFEQFIKECTIAKEFKEEWNGAIKEFYVYDCKAEKQ